MSGRSKTDPIKLNCWEMMNCGREPGGYTADILGICPAASAEECNDINGGKNAGRICWAIAGTFCKDKAHGCQAAAIATCMTCEVYEKVKSEENNETFHLLSTGQSCSSLRK